MPGLRLGSTVKARPGNDGLLRLNRSQKFLGLFARWKAAYLAIVGIVLGRIGRFEGYPPGP